jgi:autotransporter-associated beta strand protein
MWNRLVLAPTLSLLAAIPAGAETWNLTSGDAFWGNTTSWTENTVPNAIGSVATFNSPTGTRTATLNDGTNNPCPAGLCNFTVGTINFTNDSGSTTTIRNQTGNTRTGGSLVFDATGAGPALITAAGTGSNQNLITASMLFTDSVTVDVTNTVGNAAAGALSLTGDITGPGGLTKNGPGTLTMAFISGQTAGIKEFEGPTIINAGRLRLSQGGTPSKTSSVAVNSGGQILLITGVAGSNTGIYTFGSSASTLITLNGTGLAANPGAIRLETGNAPPTQITNLIDLASTSAFNVNGAANQLKLNNSISGSGGLIVGALGNTGDTGTLYLQAANTFSGGTTVNLGTLTLEGAAANLGTGDVLVEGLATGTAGKLIIQSEVTNAIADNRTLNLTGGGSAGFADAGFVELNANDTVGGLILGGVTKAPGTYGAHQAPPRSRTMNIFQAAEC